MKLLPLLLLFGAPPGTDLTRLLLSDLSWLLGWLESQHLSRLLGWLESQHLSRLLGWLESENLSGLLKSRTGLLLLLWARSSRTLGLLLHLVLAPLPLVSFVLRLSTKRPLHHGLHVPLRVGRNVCLRHSLDVVSHLPDSSGKHVLVRPGTGHLHVAEKMVLEDHEAVVRVVEPLPPVAVLIRESFEHVPALLATCISPHLRVAN